MTWNRFQPSDFLGSTSKTMPKYAIQKTVKQVWRQELEIDAANMEEAKKIAVSAIFLPTNADCVESSTSFGWAYEKAEPPTPPKKTRKKAS